jgi:AraC-like DNA-binding protein
MSEGPDPIGIPRDTLRFLDEQIHSVEQLEVLLLLHREPDRWWTAPELATKLRTSESSIQQRLEDLTGRSLAQAKLDGSPTVFRLGVLEPGWSEVIQSLAELYRDRRVAIIDRIFLKPKASLLGFANAFRIKKEQPS